MSGDAEAGTASRLLALLAVLQSRRDWTGAELAARLGVTTRTVRRDVDRLRALGYPIASSGGRTGGYALGAGTAMPPLLLDDEEALAIVVGLRTAAGSAVAGIEETALRALVKLEQILPSHLRRRVRTLSASTSVLASGGGSSVPGATLSAVATAVRDRETVRFAYRKRDGSSSSRVVEPHALVTVSRRWYLVAFDPARDGWRTFRVDRMGTVSAGGSRFTARTVPGGDAAAFVQRVVRDRPYEFEATVVYAASAEEVARRATRDFGPVTPLGPSSCRVRLGDDDVTWLALKIALPGVPYAVDAPPAVRERLAELGGWMVAAGEVGTPGIEPGTSRL